MPLTIWVAIGGALGSVARYWVALWMVPLSRDLPWGTIAINIVGSFLIAFFGSLTVAQGRFPISEAGRIFFMVGVCGGFTTFSSFSLQTLELLKAGAVTRAMLNIGLSVLFCIISATAGYLLAERLNGSIQEVAQNIVEEEA